MSQFIREVDEEYRQDQLRHLLGRYWVALLGLAVLVLAVVGGWRGYVYYRQQQSEAASTRYVEATGKAREDRAGSMSALDRLAADGPAGYRLLARFRMAAEQGQTDAAAGAKAFDALAGDPGIDPNLRDIARLRAALLLADSADAAELRRRFEPLADANAPFRNIAREVLAASALKRGDDADAKKWLDAEMIDPVATQDQRQRAALFQAIIRSGKPGEIAPPFVPPAPGPVSPFIAVPPQAEDPAPAADQPPSEATQPPVAEPQAGADQPKAEAPAAPVADPPSSDVKPAEGLAPAQSDAAPTPALPAAPGPAPAVPDQPSTPKP